MKRRLYLLLFLLLMLPLTGCWDRLEINDVAIVDVVGIDKSPKGLLLTVAIIVPEVAAPGKGVADGGKGTGAVVSFSAEGETVMDAAIKIQEHLSRRLFWAHARVLVFSEAYARSGVRTALDFWTRHREPRRRIKIAITPGSAREFVEAKPALEHLLSEAVRETINLELQTNVEMKEFARWLRNKTEEAIAPRVALVKRPTREDALVSGTALFRDDRLVGWLDDGETRGLLWLRGEIRTGVVTLKIPSGGQVSLRLIRAKTRIKPAFTNGKVRFKVQVEVEDDISESSAPLDMGKVEIVNAIQELLRERVKERVEQTLHRLQKEFGVDAVGFGDAVYRAAPRLWEGGLKDRWAEEFRQVPIEVIVTARVARSGEVAAPLTVEERQVKRTPQEMMRSEE